MQHLYPLELQCDYSSVTSSGEKNDLKKNIRPSTRIAAAIVESHIQDQAETDSHIMQSE